MASLSLLLLSACGDDGGSPGGITVSEYSSGYVENICAKAAGCCAPIELKYQFGFVDPPVTDQAGCEAFVGPLLEAGLVVALQASIDAGRAEFDGARAAECIAELEALTCSEYATRVKLFADVKSDCNPIIGKVADGGTCSASFDCTSGYCDGASATTEGTCAALPGEGDACPTAQCATGLQCDFTTSICMTYKADGAECTLDAECASNGCSDIQGSPGVCGAPSMCDDDLTNDENEIYGHCDMSETIGTDITAIDCNFGTAGAWECECNLDGTISNCSPDSTSEQDPAVCDNYGCCGF